MAHVGVQLALQRSPGDPAQQPARPGQGQHLRAGQLRRCLAGSSLAASTRSSSAAGAVCTASAWFVGERADVVAQVQLGVAALLKALLECLADEGGRGGAGGGFGAGPPPRRPPPPPRGPPPPSPPPSL